MTVDRASRAYRLGFAIGWTVVPAVTITALALAANALLSRWKVTPMALLNIEIVLLFVSVVLVGHVLRGNLAVVERLQRKANSIRGLAEERWHPSYWPEIRDLEKLSRRMAVSLSAGVAVLMLLLLVRGIASFG